jgi:hypothetical protein
LISVVPGVGGEETGDALNLRCATGRHYIFATLYVSHAKIPGIHCCLLSMANLTHYTQVTQLSRVLLAMNPL